MKLAIISDTHGSHEKATIPECDVLIHCGDWTAWDSGKEYGQFLSWMVEQPAEHVIFIQGNHDNLNSWVEVGEQHGTGIHYLHDTSVEIDGVKFYGSPWTPEFFDWHWMLPRNSDELREKWEAIPEDTDVLITHGPPHGTLDMAGTTRAGCELLAERVRQLDFEFHCFGHIHESYGETLDGRYINAAMMDSNMIFRDRAVIREIEG